MAMTAFATVLSALPASTRADNGQQTGAHTPSPAPAMPGNAPDLDTRIKEDFAGLTFTDDQKAQIERIRQDTEKRKATVAHDTTLNSDQKDAMIQGYARLEYGQIFHVLTPEQRREVRRKVAARQAPSPLKQQPPK